MQLLIASKHYKRENKGKQLHATLIDINEFDGFLSIVSEKAKTEKKTEKKTENIWEHNFIFRIRGKHNFQDCQQSTSVFEHYCFGQVLIDTSKTPPINFLLCDTSGIAHVELLGADAGEKRLFWQQTVNLIGKIQSALGKQQVKIYTNADIIQTSGFGCAFFSSYGCFDLSNVKDYLPMKPHNDEEKEPVPYQNIFEYMDAKANDNSYAPLQALRQKYGKHFELYEQFGVTVSCLPQHVIRNQESFGGTPDRLTHNRGLLARVNYDGQESQMPLKGRKRDINTNERINPGSQTLIESYEKYKKQLNDSDKLINDRLNVKIYNSRQDVANFLEKNKEVTVNHHITATSLKGIT